MTTILQEAQEIIYGDREETYGRPDKNLNAIAALWTDYLFAKAKGGTEGIFISPQDVCMMMVLMKVARQVNSFKRDNLVDICGYAALNDRLENPQELTQCSSSPKKKSPKPSTSSKRTVHTTV
jgi:Domain of unknown function (DUF6378)